MESAGMGAAQDQQRKGWTVFELLVLTPFAFLFWHVWNEPLVVQAPNPVQSVAGNPATTVEQRIAPIAQVAYEAVAAPAEVISVQATVKEVALSDPIPATKQQQESLRIEITDATGVKGFAGAVAQALEGAGVTIDGTSTTTPGSQRRTVILFGKGLEKEARRLGALFNHPPALVAATDDRAGLRLVLGSMAVRHKLALMRDAAPAGSKR